MCEKITPRIDIAFKKIFGVEENKDLLISLINSIVSEEDQVEDLKILNPYNVQSFREDKLSILDIKAKGLNGHQFNVEIQLTDEANYEKRALYYWSKLYIEQLKASESYTKLKKTIGIHILNFTTIDNSENYHHTFQLLDPKSKVKYFKDIELHTIELNKFDNSSSDNDFNEFINKIKDALGAWIAFLTKNDLLDKNNLHGALNNPGIKKALSVLEIMNFSEDEREAYEERLKWYRVEASTIENIERKSMERGLEQGIAQGLEQGREQGLEQGLEQGREQEKISIAIQLLAQNIPLDVVSSATGISEIELQKLKDK